MPPVNGKVESRENQLVNASGYCYDKRTVEAAYNSMLKYKPIILITSQDKSMGDSALRYGLNIIWIIFNFQNDIPENRAIRLFEWFELVWILQYHCTIFAETISKLYWNLVANVVMVK